MDASLAGDAAVHLGAVRGSERELLVVHTDKYGDTIGAISGTVNAILGLVLFLVGLFFGALPVVQHYGLRLAMWRRKLIPLRWVKFLDYAAEHYLLRKVGGGYVFWHEYLRVYFKKKSTLKYH